MWLGYIEVPQDLEAQKIEFGFDKQCESTSRLERKRRTIMDFLKLTRDRYSVRNYSNKRVEQGNLIKFWKQGIMPLLLPTLNLREFM